MSRRRFDLDARVVIVFLAVAIPFVVIGAFVVMGLVRSSVRGSVEAGLEQRALEGKALIERAIAEQLVHLRLLAVDPEVRGAVRATMARRDGPAASSPLAARLREMARVRPSVQLLQVVDASGRVAAASGRTVRARQEDSDWFLSMRSGDSNGPFIGDVRRPPGRPLASLDLAYPIVDEPGGEWAGAVHAAVDAGELYAVLGPVRIGATGRALLVRGSDGIVLASDEPSRVLTDPFLGYDRVQAAMRAHRVNGAIDVRRAPGAPDEAMRRPARLFAYSRIDQLPQVDWLVVVEQDLDEALAPVRDASRYLWLHFFGAFGSLVLLAIYIAVGLHRPVFTPSVHAGQGAAMPRRRSGEREDDAGAA